MKWLKINTSKIEIMTSEFAYLGHLQDAIITVPSVS
jgi:hypothetical protein